MSQNSNWVEFKVLSERCRRPVICHICSQFFDSELSIRVFFVCLCISISMCVCVCVCACVCACVSRYTCTHVCTCVRVRELIFNVQKRNYFYFTYGKSMLDIAMLCSSGGTIVRTWKPIGNIMLNWAHTCSEEYGEWK